MSESPLASKIIPRRRAASRASAAILADSSSESEREDDPEWNMGKSKAGPSRKKIAKGHSTGSIVEQGKDVDMERRRSSPIKKYSVKRKRRAAAQAVDGDSTASDEVAPSGENAVDSVSAPVRPKPKPKPILKVSRTASTKNKDAKPKPTVDTLDLSTLGDDEESDLTPLSSPLDPPKPAALSAAPAVPSRPVRSHPMFSAGPNARKEKDPSAPEKHFWENNSVEDDWEIGSLGKHVWIRLDGKDSGTAGVFNPQNSESGKETLWWPARVVKPNESESSLQIRLYGDVWRTLVLHKPSRDNIRSRLIRGSFVRFASYEDALQTSSGSVSPKKRAKSGGHNKLAWEKATRAQVQDSAKKAPVDIDELPPPSVLLSAIRRTNSQANLDVDLQTTGAGKGRSASRARKGKRKREATEEAEEVMEPEDVEGLVNVNDLHDLDSLDVGDGVLAREKKGKDYWPAKVLEYYPSSKWSEEARYKVLYLDNKEAVIPRSYIAHPDSDDFVTCKLGHVESAVIDDTIDADDEHEPLDLRSRSPSPQGPSPTRDRYNQLAIREQLAYVKPVLQAILRNEYGPMQEKVERFLSNDKAFLAGLAKNSANEGLMDPTQVNTLVAYLKWWCLRGESEQQGRHETGDVEDLEDEVSAVGDAPESVATEPIPSVAPSSPPPSERTTSPIVEPPPSSFVASTGAPATQLTAEKKQHEENEPDRMDTREDGIEEVVRSDISRRPTGSAAYEAMTAWQRLDFCLNILKQEAIRQILLWRRGERKSADLLSEDDEQRLYDKGQELLEEQDWIADILRLRRKAEAQDKIGVLGQEKTVSRRGRVLRKTNYAESD